MRERYNYMNINYCPLCNAAKGPKQPQESLHAFTIHYECGSEVIYGSNQKEPYILEIEKNCRKDKMSDVKSPVCNIVETFSKGLIKHAEKVREAASNLEGNTNKLSNSYFSTSFDKSESVEKEAININDKVHKILSDIQDSIERANDFMTQL